MGSLVAMESDGSQQRYFSQSTSVKVYLDDDVIMMSLCVTIYNRWHRVCQDQLWTRAPSFNTFLTSTQVYTAVIGHMIVM